jgi:hypothetical protein
MTAGDRKLINLDNTVMSYRVTRKIEDIFLQLHPIL